MMENLNEQLKFVKIYSAYQAIRAVGLEHFKIDFNDVDICDSKIIAIMQKLLETEPKIKEYLQASLGLIMKELMSPNFNVYVKMVNEKNNIFICPANFSLN